MKISPARTATLEKRSTTVVLLEVGTKLSELIPTAHIQKPCPARQCLTSSSVAEYWNDDEP